MLLEGIIVALAILRKRWWLALLPVIAAAPLAYVVVKMAPMKYVASSIILFQPANRAVGWGSGELSRQTALEQLGAVEAWLKSDHVLLELLPKLREDALADPIKTAVEMTRLRKSLTFELSGNSVLIIRLEGDRREGLGKKLETIVSRLMEGLIRPDADILSAAQLVALHLSEAAAEAERILMSAIGQAGLSNANAVLIQLGRLHDGEQQWRLRNEVSLTTNAEPPDGALRPSSIGRNAPALDKASAQLLRNQISADPAVVRELETHFAAFMKARAEYSAAARELSPKETNYVGIFEAPEKLKIVGRPQDPQLGEKQGTKIAIALLFLSMIAGAGLLFLSAVLSSRVNFRHEFVALSGLPIVARLPKAKPIRRASRSTKAG